MLHTCLTQMGGKVEPPDGHVCRHLLRACGYDRSVCSHVCISAGRLHTCVHLPAQTKSQKGEKKKKKKRLQPRVGLAAFSVSLPWPFHSATSAETSIRGSCSSQLVNLNTLLFFAKGEKEVGREREWRRDGGRGWGGVVLLPTCFNRQLEQYGSYCFFLLFSLQYFFCFYTPSLLK